MNKVMYEVWGEDTFARESYLVGTFKTREKAGKALEASEKSVLDQCEELRDTYWIVELTPEREKERKEWERNQEEQRRSKSDFDYSHLCGLISRLNSKLLEVVVQDIKGTITDKEVKLLEENEKVSDCYDSLSFQYIRGVKDEQCCLVYVEIGFKDEGRMSTSCFVGTPNQIRRQFSFKRGEKFVCRIINKMIVDFF